MLRKTRDADGRTLVCCFDVWRDEARLRTGQINLPNEPKNKE
jgi:hypothetical protein